MPGLLDLPALPAGESRHLADAKHTRPPVQGFPLRSQTPEPAAVPPAATPDSPLAR
ncbi:MAG TPA: hypothetical protein VM529_26975 [Gemmata sp.]|nr:hypothetical protein [Gemmata sp.]